jgi:hypothetical protein
LRQEAAAQDFVERRSPQRVQSFFERSDTHTLLVLLERIASG